MSPDGVARWNLDRFPERLDWWIRDTDPPQDLVIIVLTWIVGLGNNPFVGMRRVEGLKDYWFGPVPKSDNGAGEWVTCSFDVDRDTRTIRCDLFSTSTWPIWPA